MKQFLRTILTALFCVLLFCFQSALSHRLTFFGAGFDLLPIAAAAAGVLGGAAYGGWTGFALGLLADMNRPGGICLYTGIYFLLGALAGYLTHVYLRRDCPTALLLGEGFLAALHTVSFALSAFIYGGAFAGFLPELGRTLIISGLLFFPVYGLLALIDRLNVRKQAFHDAPSRRIHMLSVRRGVRS